MIFSASSVADVHNFGDSLYHLKRQALWLVPGLLAMWALARRRLSAPEAAHVAGADRRRPAARRSSSSTATRPAGAQRWIELGAGLRLQPSELAKLAVVGAVALVLAATPPHRRTISGLIKPLGLIVLPTAGLIMLQPDMGTTMSHDRRRDVPAVARRLRRSVVLRHRRRGALRRSRSRSSSRRTACSATRRS